MIKRKIVDSPALSEREQTEQTNNWLPTRPRERTMRASGKEPPTSSRRVPPEITWGIPRGIANAE